MSVQIVKIYAVTNIPRTHVIAFRPIHDNICIIVTYVEFQPITYLIIHIGRAHGVRFSIWTTYIRNELLNAPSIAIIQANCNRLHS